MIHKSTFKSCRNDRNDLVKRRWLPFLLSINIILFVVTNPSSADTTKAVIEQTIQAYLMIAFPPDRRTLVRFDNTQPIAALFHCEGLTTDECNIDTDTMRQTVHEFGNLRFDSSKRPSQLTYIFGHSEFISARSRDAQQAFQGGYTDTSDPLCQVFYATENSVIQKAEILVSEDQPVLRKKICLFVQGTQALGLSIFGSLKLPINGMRQMGLLAFLNST